MPCMAITDSLRGVGQLLAQTVYVTVSTFVTQRGAFIVLSIIIGFIPDYEPPA